MKRIYHYALCIMQCALLTACSSDWFELAPSDSVIAGDAINNSTDLETARTGMYAAFRGTSTLSDYYGRLMFVYGDVRGEDVQSNYVSGNGSAEFYYNMQYTTADQFTTGKSATSVWQTPYVLIGRACRIIEADNLEDANTAAATINLYKAEAKVLRAFALFDLARIYGKPYKADNGASLGVPIVTSSLQSTVKPSRSTVAECYAQVLADIADALNANVLPTDVATGYVNTWVAKMLQMRVYLEMGNDSKVMEIADDIIANSPYKLWTTDGYAAAWAETDASHNDEVVLETSITSSSDWLDIASISYHMTEADRTDKVAGYGNLIATKTFLDMLEEDPQDVRNDIMIASQGKLKETVGDRKVFINKYPPVSSTVLYDNIVILRLSEVYLSAAEAALNSGDNAKAADYLNALIANRTTDESRLVTSSTITMDRISQECRKEFVGEGHRFFDAMRRDETITRYADESDRGWHNILIDDALSISRSSAKALPLIPQAEIDANPNMEQNPLY